MKGAKRVLLAGLCVLAGGSCVMAQWTGGSSPVIAEGETVTVSTVQPNLVSISNNGTLVVQAGGSVCVTGAVMSVVSGINAPAVLELNGGAFTNTGTGYLVVGYLGGTGYVSIASGSILSCPNGRVRLAGNEDAQRGLPAYGEALVNGTLRAGILEFTGYFPTDLEPPYEEFARLTLNQGGVIEANSLAKNDCAASTFLFNGGTLRALQDTATFITGRGAMKMEIADNTSAVFDTNGKNVTIVAQVSPNEDVLTLTGETGASAVGNGGFVKLGAGGLTFRLPAACNTFTGAIEVVEGRLDLGRPLAENQTVTVHPGAVFIISDPADVDKIIVSGGPSDRLLYAVSLNTGGLDLTALNDRFYDDRLGSPYSGTVTLSNTLVHSASVGTVGAPFRLIGLGGTLNLTNTTLETKAVQVEGAGTFNFMGDRVFTSADAGMITLTDGGYRQSGTFAVTDVSSSTPAELAFSSGRFNIGGALDIGVNGFGTFAADGVTLASGRVRMGGGTGYAGTFAQSAGTVTLNTESWVGFDGGAGTLFVTGGQFIVNADLRVAGNPLQDRALRPSGHITVSNALLRCNTMNLNPWWTSNGECSAMEATTVTLQSGAQLEVNLIHKNDDPIASLLFEGGLLRSRGNTANLLTATQATGTLRLSAAAGHDIIVDTVGYTVGINNPAANLYFTGEGGFRKLGTGILSFACDLADYAGGTTVAAGTLRLAADNMIPDGVGKGDVHIAAGATLDLYGRNEGINRLTGTGAVISTNATATLAVLTNGSDDIWDANRFQGDVQIDKQGEGTLTLAAPDVISSDMTVSSGAVRVAPSEGYYSYRFKIDAVQTPGSTSASYMQISEFALYNEGVDVTANRSGFGYDNTGGGGTSPTTNAFPADESPDKALDGIVHVGTTAKNKWLDFRIATSRSAEDRDRVWLRVDFPSAQKVTAYNWATGNDYPSRDPATWRFQGSYDGENWVDLDVRENVAVTTNRNAWVLSEGFPVSSANTAFNPFGGQSTLTLCDGTELCLDTVSATISDLTGLGTVTLSEADLTFNTPEDSSTYFGGAITGSGSLIKTGAGTQALSATNTFTGDIVVRDGTLAVLGNVACPWFRFTIMENSVGTNVTQMSEFALYSADGVRRNIGLTQATAPDNIQPGQFATPAAYSFGGTGAVESMDKLFDNLTSTKLCLINHFFSLNDPATHRIVTMRLPDNTPEITGYNLCTANDSVFRSPVTWKLEASHDGVTWMEIDSRVNFPIPSSSSFFTWYNNGTPIGLERHAIVGGDTDTIPNSSVVEVCAGATLAITAESEVVGALRVDLAAGAGTITQLTAAEGGALYVLNADGAPHTWVIPLTIGTITNPAALRTWTVYADGKPLAGYTLSWDPVTGMFRLTTGGTILTLR